MEDELFIVKKTIIQNHIDVYKLKVLRKRPKKDYCEECDMPVASYGVHIKSVKHLIILQSNLSKKMKELRDNPPLEENQKINLSFS